MNYGTFLVRCPSTGEQETCFSIIEANDVCFDMHNEAGMYAYVENCLGHTELEYGELPPL